MLFTTRRLRAQQLQTHDFPYFLEMMQDPLVMNPIPLPVADKAKARLVFDRLYAAYQNPHPKSRVWAIMDMETEQFIGQGGLIFNRSEGVGIGYRVRSTCWGKGYGSELAAGLIDYVFTKTHYELIFADVWINNAASNAILRKYMYFTEEHWNSDFNCWDYRYTLTKAQWGDDR